MNRFLVFGLFFLLAVSGVSAGVDSSQQSNKIFLSPFYRASLTNNANVTYNVTVDPSDGVSNVVSAILTFDMWLTPTVTFSAWVNGKACNNPTYVVSTTYASSGRGVATFDCTNIINRSGSYVVTFRPSGANTGAVTAWLDLTYNNAPPGQIDVHGTEYVAGDNGKMFLQLLDADNQPINNSECFLTMWYPNGTRFMNDTYMTPLEQGVYFKNFLVPEQDGVYPASAKCYKGITFYNKILPNQVTENFESNTWTAGTGWSQCPLGDPDCQNGWDIEDTVPLSFIVTNASAASCRSGSYCAKFTGGYGYIERGFPDTFLEGTYAYNITYWLKFKGFQTNEKIEFFIFDGNWHLMRTIGLAGGYSNNVWYQFNDVVDASEFNMGTMLLGWFTKTMPSTSDEAFIDDISISYVAANISITNETQYEVLRGSGEAHVSKLQSNLIETITNVAAGGDGKYAVTSCDGFADGRCATFVETSDADWTEKELRDEVTIVGKKTGSTKIRYESPFTVDCTALYSVKEWNGSGWASFSNYTLSSNPGDENCEIVLQRNIVMEATYMYEFLFDNYMKWEVDWSMEQINATKPEIDAICLDRNWTYTVPVTNVTNMSTDTVTRYCHLTYDDMYWADTYYSDSSSAANAGEYVSYVHEMRLYAGNVYNRREYLMSGKLFPLTIAMNQTLTDIRTNVTSIKNDTSLLSQMWTWLLAVFNWVGTDIDQNASTSIASLVEQSVQFVEAQYYQQQSSAIVAQVQRGGLSVTGANCGVNVFYPNMTAFVSGTMSFTGIDGMYSYSWTPEIYGSHIAQVNCSGGTLVGQVQSSGSLGVSAPNSGVVMSVIG